MFITFAFRKVSTVAVPECGAKGFSDYLKLCKARPVFRSWITPSSTIEKSSNNGHKEADGSSEILGRKQRGPFFASFFEPSLTGE